MNFIKKLLKKFFKKQKEDKDTWDYDAEKLYQENWPSLSIARTEEISFLSLTIESEKQFEIEVFEAIYEKEYIIFTKYEDFKDYLIRNNIVNSSLRNYDYIKNRRLQNILSFLEAHIRSYFYTYNEGFKYGILNDTMDLLEWRRKSYETDCVEWFKNINYDCEKYGIKYLFSYSDIEQYCKEYLAY